MKIIVGLGNPGKQYEQTKHNAGFMVLDHIAKELNVSFQSSKFKGLLAQTKIGNEQVLLLKPQTFMNLSGESVIQAMKYYQINIADLVVIYDDKDTEVGDIRLRPKGSAGGQNGVKSIIQHLGSQEFNRIRIGIGKNDRMNMADYVMSTFAKQDKPLIEEAIVKASEAALAAITKPFGDVMTKYNTKPIQPKKEPTKVVVGSSDMNE